MHFLGSQGIVDDILRDEDEWKDWKERGDPVLHIEVYIPTASIPHEYVVA